MFLPSVLRSPITRHSASRHTPDPTTSRPPAARPLYPRPGSRRWTTSLRSRPRGPHSLLLSLLASSPILSASPGCRPAAAAAPLGTPPKQCLQMCGGGEESVQ